MHSYPALRTTATIIKVVTALGAIVGLIAGLVIMANSGFLQGLGAWLMTALYAVFLWASAELLLVFANMGEDLSKMGGEVSDLLRLQRRAEDRAERLAKTDNPPAATGS